MYVVLGASGRTGHIVAETLLAKSQPVRVVGRNADRLKEFADKGAEIFEADMSDGPALTKAFKGAQAGYVMIPPEVTNQDYRGFQDRVSDAIAAAAQNSKIKHIVTLSSFGADKASGTGPVVGLHNLEQKLNSIEELNALHLRAGYFMENVLPQVNVIRMMGGMAGPVRPDLKLPMIATKDIGEAAADELLRRQFEGKRTRELQGQRDLDYIEVASIVGKAIGKPTVSYVQAPDAQLRGAMVQMGMSANFVGLILEMAGALNSGHMKALEPRSSGNTTPTSFETFVLEEFVPAFRDKNAAA